LWSDFCRTVGASNRARSLTIHNKLIAYHFRIVKDVLKMCLWLFGDRPIQFVQIYCAISDHHLLNVHQYVWVLTCDGWFFSLFREHLNISYFTIDWFTSSTATPWKNFYSDLTSIDHMIFHVARLTHWLPLQPDNFYFWMDFFCPYSNDILPS
jgi:hypothetical protein